MTEAFPNYAMLATQILVYAIADPEFTNRFMLIPRGHEACEVRYSDGLSCTIKASMTIEDAADKLQDFIHQAVIGD